jgi:hypothetical protein
MKLLIITALIFLTSFTEPGNDILPKSPLSDYSTAWNDPRFLKCNTAAKAVYLTDMEKELIYVFNMMRMDPKLFNSTVVKQYPDKSYFIYLNEQEEWLSLQETMATLEPLPLLYPDVALSASAKCHAITSGQKGYIGHDRQTSECKKKVLFDAECCDYGRNTPLDIVMGLLIDEGVPGLGHRRACLSPYKKIGVSIQPHKTYGKNAVLDLGW